jgi:glutathione peroxidase
MTMKKLFGMLLLGTLVLAGPAHAACSKLLDVTLPNLQDEPTRLCQYEGKVLLVVNTASRCGNTPQYEGLEKLYRRYKDKGLVVLGFPANDFAGQEPGSNKDIADFCQLNYGVSFPMFSKTGVTARNANSLYAGLAERTGRRPQWNFHKYLVDRRGEVVLSFENDVQPNDAKLVASIERLLAAR